MGDDARVQAAVTHVAGLARASGWPCCVSPELGSFRGPGRKDDPCPYATLAVCEMELVAGLPHEARVRDGAEALLSQWSARRERHPYMFYMGTDFCKLKAPLIWYDVLHVVDVLSRLPWLSDDPRLHEMISVMVAKLDSDRRATPESVWTAWEFGQKKVPSRWVTLLVERARRRISN